jgi:hypothetical protein
MDKNVSVGLERKDHEALQVFNSFNDSWTVAQIHRPILFVHCNFEQGMIDCVQLAEGRVWTQISNGRCMVAQEKIPQMDLILAVHGRQFNCRLGELCGSAYYPGNEIMKGHHIIACRLWKIL